MRIVRNDEVAGSTPVSSTKTPINTHFSTSHLAMDASGFTSGLPEKEFNSPISEESIHDGFS
jgi:hypothetical protein